MGRLSHRDYVDEQYDETDRLSARVNLHARFSTNETGWARWVFEQLDLSRADRVFEVGCGTATLWTSNIEGLPRRAGIILSDRSPGMVGSAREALAGAGSSFSFLVADVSSLPFDDESCDVIIANHMLYHVLDLDSALKELERVLRRNGRLYASTVGLDHMGELKTLVREQVPDTPYGSDEERPSFCLENGAEVLSRHFGVVEKRSYDDALVVTESEPLVAYVASLGVGGGLDGVRAEVEQRVARDGAVLITKSSGLFLARR